MHAWGEQKIGEKWAEGGHPPPPHLLLIFRTPSQFCSLRVRFWKSLLHRLHWFMNWHYYLFKIFPLFCLVKPTRIIHHNQLLLTNFEKNLCDIQPMTLKVQPAADYWTDDDKMTSKVQLAADYWTVDWENLGTRLCYFWWAEKQRAKGRNAFKNEEIFWIKYKAIIEFGFRRIWTILQITEGVIHLRPLWITPFLICRTLHILLSLTQYN